MNAFETETNEIATRSQKKILRIRDLSDRGYGSRTTIWRKIKSKKIPAPIEFLGKPAWFLEKMEKFETDQFEASDDE